MTRPYFSDAATLSCSAATTGGNGACTWNTFDDTTDRVASVTRPDGGVTAAAYVGATGAVTVTATETIKSLAATETQEKKSTFNVLGQLVETIDGSNASSPAKAKTSYAYNAQGNLSEVKIGPDPGTLLTVATLVYDAAGNRTGITDANTGTSGYEYDAFGELVEMTDAKNQTTTFQYDALGRPTQRIDDLNGANQVTNTWDWDAPNATGALQVRSNTHGSPTNGWTWTQTLAYEPSGLPDTVTTAIDVDQHEVDHAGSYVQSFDWLDGRIATVTYPSAVTATHEYNLRGYPEKVKEGGVVRQQFTAVDVRGNVTTETFGNGIATVRTFDAYSGRASGIETGLSSAPRAVQDLVYQWRSNSSLYQRTDERDTASDLTDTFAYDKLERLLSQTTSVGATRTLSFTYDLYGNLTGKDSSVAGDLDVTGYQYAAPHRLTQVTIGGATTTLTTDANGSITSYASSVSTTLVYDGANRATSITSTDGSLDRFWYDPDGQRFLAYEGWTAGGAGSRFKVHVGSFEETHPQTGSQYRKVEKSMLTDAVVHYRLTPWVGNAVTQLEYAHRDHLGSVMAVTSAAGVHLDGGHELSLDPFGGHRKADWSGDLTSLTTIQTALDGVRYERGFTDHEHRTRTKFIHMNGRVFDPRIGRFTSADPYVPYPTHSQSWNRYSYVRNNPVSSIDPSGYFDYGNVNQGDSFLSNAVLSEMESGGLGWVTGASGARLASGMVVGGVAATSPLAQETVRVVYSVTIEDVATTDPDAQEAGSAGTSTESGSGNFWPLPFYAPGGTSATNASNSPGLSQSQQSPPATFVGRVLGAVVDVVGKIWNIPNTVIGVAYGIAGYVVGTAGNVLGLNLPQPEIRFGHNAIEFVNNPITISGAAITLGNAVSYGSPAAPSNVGRHEEAHTFQGQALGPLFLPAYVLNSFEGWSANPFERA